MVADSSLIRPTARWQLKDAAVSLAPAPDVPEPHAVIGGSQASTRQIAGAT